MRLFRIRFFSSFVVLYIINSPAAIAQKKPTQHAVSFQFEMAPEPNTDLDATLSRTWALEQFNRIGQTWEIGKHFGIGYDYFPIWSLRSNMPTDFYSLLGGHIKFRSRLKGLYPEKLDMHIKLVYAYGSYCFYPEHYQTCQAVDQHYMGGGYGGDWHFNKRWSFGAELVYYADFFHHYWEREQLMWFWFGIKWYAFYRIDPSRSNGRGFQ